MSSDSAPNYLLLKAGEPRMESQEVLSHTGPLSTLGGFPCCWFGLGLLVLINEFMQTAKYLAYNFTKYLKSVNKQRIKDHLLSIKW